jgi:hypothetical protein
MSDWSRIPYTVFHDIMVHSSAQDLHRFFHVCLAWRQLAVSCSDIWRSTCDIRLLSHPSVPRSLWPIEAFSEPSLPLHIYTDVKPTALCVPRLSKDPTGLDVYQSPILLHELRRAVSLCASIGEDDRFVIRPSSLSLIGTFPVLQELRLSAGVGVLYPDEMFTFDPRQFKHTPLHRLVAPNLHKLLLSDIDLQWSTLQQAQLSILHITNNRYPLSLCHLASVLNECPRLTEVSLKGVTQSQDMDDSTTTIGAPLLTRCHLDSQEPFCDLFFAFFTRLDAPNLCALSITTACATVINMDLFDAFIRRLRAYLQPTLLKGPDEAIPCDEIATSYPHTRSDVLLRPTSVGFRCKRRTAMIGVYSLVPPKVDILSQIPSAGHLVCALNGHMSYRIDYKSPFSPVLPVGRPLRLSIEGRNAYSFFASLLNTCRLPPAIHLHLSSSSVTILPTSVIAQPLLYQVRIFAPTAHRQVARELEDWIQLYYPSIYCSIS